MKTFNILVPKQNDVVILSSDEWFVFDLGTWRFMNAQEQMEASK